MQIKPFGPIAGAFIQDNSEVAVIKGPVGSAKTTAACLRLARHAYEQTPDPDGVARTRFAIVRNTRRQLIDTTKQTWLQVFPESEFGAFQATAMTHCWQFKPRGSDYSIDAEFVFRALDDEADVTNLLSAEYTGAWFNEVREINQEILTHMGRRVGRFPSNRCKWFGWIGDTNAWDVEHHLHKALVIDPPPGFTLFEQPGGLDPGAENVENLPGGLDYYHRAVRDYSPTDAAIYVHARYGMNRSGKPIYVSYADAAHCKDFALDKGAPLLIGYDFGRTPAAVIAQKSNTGQWLIAREFVGFDIGVAEHAAQLRRYIATEFPGLTAGKVTGDPSGRAKDAHDLDMFRIIQRELGGIAIPARTNDPATRIEAVDGCFRRMINGGPAILIHPKCKMLRAACISEYKFRKLKISGGERYSDAPEKNDHSHVAEALQYLLLGGGEGRAAMGGAASMSEEQFARACAARNSRADWNPMR